VSVGSGSTSGWSHVDGGDGRGWPQEVCEWEISKGETDCLDREQGVRQYLNPSLTSYPSHARLGGSSTWFHVAELHPDQSPLLDASWR
jgi:hypothetical protein